MGQLYFLIRESSLTLKKDYAYSSELRMKFNDVLEKMVVNTSLVETISNQVDQYENSRNAFGKKLSICQRKTKSPRKCID